MGISEISRPISHNADGAVGGYCADVIDALSKKGYKIQPAFITLSERFKGKTEDRKTKQEIPLNAECGPNTINQTRIENLKNLPDDSGKFSEVFAWTPYTLLIRKGKSLDRDKTRFGVLGTADPSITTTTEIWLRKEFGAKNIQVLKDRDEVLSALKNDQIEAYVNDEILLLGLLAGENGESVRAKYDLFKEVSASSETFQSRYGLVIYKANSENKQLLNDINSLITTGNDVKIMHSTLRRLSSSKNLDDFERKWSASQEEDPVVASPTSPSPSLTPTPISPDIHGKDRPIKNLDEIIIFFTILGFFALIILAIKHGSTNINNSNRQERHDNKIQGNNNAANQDGDKNKIEEN